MQVRTSRGSVLLALFLLGIAVGTSLLFFLGAVSQLFPFAGGTLTTVVFWITPAASLASLVVLLFEERRGALRRGRGIDETPEMPSSPLAKVATISIGIVVAMYAVLLGAVLIFRSVGEGFAILALYFVPLVGSSLAFASLALAIARGHQVRSR